MNKTNGMHPLGTGARVLLSSVFGPYARDDEFGSRKINPMELYHNQVTRLQGAFSLRMFHRSFGLMMLQANIEAPCTLLDFPTLEHFTAEIREHAYDIVGIGSIMPNVGKVKEMCRLVRQHLPRATIVVGGHISNLTHIETLIDADHVVKGDGVRWFRRFLGQDEEAPVRHPLSYSGFGGRIAGLPLRRQAPSAILIPSVGCPMGCNFCCTSALFGGKGKFVNFYETGDTLFSVICEIEEKLRVKAFFVLDENFLLHKERALRLLELMEEHDKPWAFYVFSSAKVLQSYSIEQLVRLGISWVWMGLEGQQSQYDKLQGIDTRALVKELQSHGIRVLGSTIIGLENHTPENLAGVIDWAVSHETDFHQFMLYTSMPGTPLHCQHADEGRLLPEALRPAADIHGQYRFNYTHPHIPAGEETGFLLAAFRKDFEINGPSLARMIGTILQGWQRYKKHPDPRVRERFEREAARLRDSFAACAWAMRKWAGDNAVIRGKMNHLLGGLYREFGWTTRLIAPLMGRWVFHQLKKEAEKLSTGWSYEPVTCLEKNAPARDLEKKTKSLKSGLPQPGQAACPLCNRS